MHKLAQILTGIGLPCEVWIGRNFVIDHVGGVIITGYAVFGDDCRVWSGVVVGLSQVDDPCAPRFGNNVDIDTGAKLRGRIAIGDNVQIGANAVVLHDVPPKSIAVGVPAVIRARKRPRLRLAQLRLAKPGACPRCRPPSVDSHATARDVAFVWRLATGGQIPQGRAGQEKFIAHPEI